MAWRHRSHQIPPRQSSERDTDEKETQHRRGDAFRGISGFVEKIGAPIADAPLSSRAQRRGGAERPEEGGKFHAAPVTGFSGHSRSKGRRPHHDRHNGAGEHRRDEGELPPHRRARGQPNAKCGDDRAGAAGEIDFHSATDRCTGNCSARFAWTTMTTRLPDMPMINAPRIESGAAPLEIKSSPPIVMPPIPAQNAGRRPICARPGSPAAP